MLRSVYHYLCRQYAYHYLCRQYACNLRRLHTLITDLYVHTDKLYNILYRQWCVLYSRREVFGRKFATCTAQMTNIKSSISPRLLMSFLRSSLLYTARVFDRPATSNFRSLQRGSWWIKICAMFFDMNHM